MSVSVEQVVELVRERSTRFGREKRVTRSTLVSAFGVSMDEAGSLMWQAQCSGLVKIVGKKGNGIQNATIVLV